MKRLASRYLRSAGLGAWLLTLGSVGVILHLTLRPYDFQIPSALRTAGLAGLLGAFLSGPVDPADILNNIVLFVPLGVGLAWLLERRGYRVRGALLLALALGAGLSLSVELIQLFLPTRTATPADVATNTFGAGAGVLLLHGARLALASPRNQAAALAGYALAGLLLSLPLQSAARLSGWDDQFPLIVGTQHDEEAWEGTVFDLWIANDVIAPDQIGAFGRPGQPQPPLGDAVLAAYQFAGAQPYADRAGRSPDLLPRAAGVSALDSGVALRDGAWLESPAPAGALNQGIAHTSRFTLIATVAGRPQQPTSEIVSINGADYRRNLIVGQQRRNLFLRVRNGATGEKAASLAPIIIRDVFADTLPHRLIVTYDRGAVRVYVDGHAQPNVQMFSPDLALWTTLLPSKVAELLMKQRVLRLDARFTIVYELLYYCLLFVPLGLLLALVSRHWLGAFYPRARAALLLGLAAGFALMLELALALAGGRPIEAGRLLISLAVAALAWRAWAALVGRRRGRLQADGSLASP
ncbi:VanZ family protein [Kouleothrix sp.]|uniref:VanZ family protein n=1 Tax=Kouleothrix sp. TaxID=2779161 RepID=UPI00391CDBDC